MKLRPALIASVIGIYVLSIVASGYVGVRLVGRLPSLLPSGGTPYYRHWTRGDNAVSRGDYFDAIHEYDKMVALRPNKVEGYTYRAIAEYRAGLYNQAIQDNTTGIQLLTQRRGIEEQGVPQGMSYQDQLESVPDSQARLYHNRAVVYSKLEDIPRATRDFKQAIALKPDSPAYYGALSSLYQHTRQYGLNAANWRNALAILPDNSYCWANFGWAQYQLGNLSEAIDASLRAIRLNPKAVTARYNLALCYAVRDQWARAEPVYREAMALRAPAEQPAALKGVRDALKAHPNSQSLRKSEALLMGY